ncbi:acid phosphatase type 7-like [Lytechinus variegatus]|uniref:acid phosphatase type 7-like n=1 Tax=Lytechinus variegatus TaxID=7654 RepID=UPI001BB25A1F|nr:acid phosphatase type 7-like [Lytechinus variegatus]
MLRILFFTSLCGLCLALPHLKKNGEGHRKADDVLLSLAAGDPVFKTQPEQIHISATGDVTEMTVTWSTFNQTKQSVVYFGLSLGNLSSVAKGSATKFVDEGPERHTQYIHRVKLTSLKPGTLYTYRCGSDEGWSSLLTFKTLQAGAAWSPTFAVYGDMGNDNAQSLARLQIGAQNREYDAILHVGDFAYDFSFNNGAIGDEFMRQIESVAGYVPYMTCPGNHEFHYNFSHYKNRFTMPRFEDTQNLWYSWNVGPAHIISFSTEVYFYVYYGLHLIVNQFNWLKADLLEANKPENRKERPWIITMGHRPAYCTNNDADDCTKNEGIIRSAVEELFYNNGVDVEFWAHEHSYERLWPVYNRKVYNGSLSEPYTNPKAPVHIITGSAGCRERRDPFSNTEPWDAFRSNDYGYTKMHIINTTHIDFEQISDDKGGAVIDSFTLIKDKHGPEAWL